MSVNQSWYQMAYRILLRRFRSLNGEVCSHTVRHVLGVSPVHDEALNWLVLVREAPCVKFCRDATHDTPWVHLCRDALHDAPCVNPVQLNGLNFTVCVRPCVVDRSDLSVNCVLTGFVSMLTNVRSLLRAVF